MRDLVYPILEAPPTNVKYYLTVSILGKFVATRLRSAIAERALTIRDAAIELQISRQMLHSYLQGKSVPGDEVMRRAIELWGVRLEQTSKEILSTSNLENNDGSTVIPYSQLGGWFLREEARTENLPVRVRRVEGVVELTIRLELPIS